MECLKLTEIYINDAKCDKMVCFPKSGHNFEKLRPEILLTFTIE